MAGRVFLRIFIACFCVIFLSPFIIVVVLLAIGPVTTRNAIRFSVTNATLSQFEISDNNTTLRYDLALEMVVTKPCGTGKVKYYQIEANGYYGSQRFSNNVTLLDPFVQYALYYTDDEYSTCRKPDPVNILRPVFKGQNTIILDATESSRFKLEKQTMVYNILMEMQLRIRVFGTFRRSYNARVGCGLRVPLTGAGGGGAPAFKYTITKCKTHYS